MSNAEKASMVWLDRLVDAMASGVGGNAQRLPVKRLPDSIIFARRNTACICVHSRTDKEHCDPFLSTSLLVKARHCPC